MQRSNTRRFHPVWPGLFWTLALLGLFLLPTDYRAGAETAHGHALIQLWLDAADGVVQHHHAPHAQGAAWDWLEPGVTEAGDAEASRGAAGPDVGEHQDSAPVAGAVHLLVQTVLILALATARDERHADSSRTPRGRIVQVLLPPPRWTPAAA